MSSDGNHVLEDLRSRFDEVLAALEAVAGWRTERIQRPVLILDELDGVQILVDHRLVIVHTRPHTTRKRRRLGPVRAPGANGLGLARASGMQAGSVVASIYARSGNDRLRRYATDPETARARQTHAPADPACETCPKRA